MGGSMVYPLRIGRYLPESGGNVSLFDPGRQRLSHTIVDDSVENVHYVLKQPQDRLLLMISW